MQALERFTNENKKNLTDKISSIKNAWYRLKIPIMKIRKILRYRGI